MYNFKKGQEVVCVNDTIYHLPLNGLKKDEIYVVEYTVPTFEGRSIDGVVLEGMTSGHPLGVYHVTRFKPLVKENISREEVIKEVLI